MSVALYVTNHFWHHCPEYPANIAAVSGSAPRSRRLHLSVALPVALAQMPPQNGIGYKQQ